MKLSIVAAIGIALTTMVSAYPVRRVSAALAERDIAYLGDVLATARSFEDDLVERGLFDVIKAMRKETPEEKAHRKEYKAQVKANKKFQAAAGKVISAQAKKEMGKKDHKNANIAMTWQSYKGSGGEYERRAKKHLEGLVRKDWSKKTNQQNMRHADLSIEVLKTGRIMGQVRYNNGPNQIPQSSNTFLWDQKDQ